MNEQRRAMLTRRAMGRATTSGSLLLKARALADLARAQIPCAWDRLPDERRELIRVELLNVVVVSERLASYDAARAEGIALGLLERLDGEAEDEDAPPPPPWRWEGLSDEDREAELSLNLMMEMSRALGWRVTQQEWSAGDPHNSYTRDQPKSKRIVWLGEQADVILSADDPMQAADDWLRDPPQIPAAAV
jgi:hypothetical protein